MFSGERVTAIKCYLTGENMGGNQFNIRRLHIKDKHGLSRVAYNAKVNIYREIAEPILLGIEDRSCRWVRSLSSARRSGLEMCPTIFGSASRDLR